MDILIKGMNIEDSITWSNKTPGHTKLYCKESGYLCEFATEFGYCQMTACIKSEIVRYKENKQMTTISQQMINAYFDCKEPNPKCEECPLNRVIKIENEDVFMCVLFSQFMEEVYEKIKKNMFK